MNNDVTKALFQSPGIWPSTCRPGASPSGILARFDPGLIRAVFEVEKPFYFDLGALKLLNQKIKKKFFQRQRRLGLVWVTSFVWILAMQFLHHSLKAEC